MKIGASASFNLPKQGLHDAILAECVEMPEGKFGPNAALIFLIGELDGNDEPQRILFFFNPKTGFGSPDGKGTAFRKLLQKLTGKQLSVKKLKEIASDSSAFDIEKLYGLRGKIFLKHHESEDKEGNEKVYARIDPDLCEPGDNDLDLEGYTPWDELQRKNAKKAKGSGQQQRSKKRVEEEEPEEDDSDFSPPDDDDEDDDRTRARKISSGKSKTKSPWD